jgi:ATP-binding cassette, subfamily F, member 3
MLLIGANGIAVEYGGRTIFSDVSLDVTSGERIGVVGENGAGKSTLLRVLAGRERADEGAVTFSKAIRVGYLEQEPHFAPEQTVYEAVASADEALAAAARRLAESEARLADASADEDAMRAALEEYGAAQHRYEALGGYEHDARVRRVLEGLELRGDMLSQPAERLSGGQKKLVGLAQLLVTEPDVLLLDEPDNHLDFEGKAFLEAYVREYRGAVAIISHDRYLLDRVAQRIVEVEDGAVASWTGGYSAYVEQKETHLARQREIYQVQQEALRRQEEAMHRLVQWAKQNPKFAGRAENMKKQVERKRAEMIERPRLVRRRIALDFGQHEGSRRVLSAEGLTLRVGGGTGRVLLADASFGVAFGERVGIVGPNGSGKSTLLKAMAGQLAPASGELRLGITVHLGYYAQEQETLPLDQTPLEWIRQQKALTEQAGINRLRRLLLTYEDIHTPIGRLSGGQKSRLQFERLMLGDYNLLVLDEPTNNIDIASAEVLEAALQEFEGTAVIVSHDRYLLDHAVDRIIELPGDGTLREYAGNYSYYLEQRTAASSANGSRPQPPEGKPATPGQRTSSSATSAPPAAFAQVNGRSEGAEAGRSAPAERSRSTNIRRASLAIVGLPGVGKRTLLAELAGHTGATGDARAEAQAAVPLGEAVEAEMHVATLANGAAEGVIETARRAGALLLAHDLAAEEPGHGEALRRALAAAGIVPVPQPLPVVIRPRAKGGLTISGDDEAARETLLRWCRGRQITHAEAVVHGAVPPDVLALYAEAAWLRVGGARARQSTTLRGIVRPALVVGTRHDELEHGAADTTRAEERLRLEWPGFAVVAVSVLDDASIARLRAALGELLAG